MFDFSLILPVYYNAETLEFIASELCEKILKRNDGLKGEIVFVDDGSQDASFDELKKIYEAHPECVRVFRLSKNFGQVNALWCGFTHCSNTVLFMSADGQEPVELVNRMLHAHFCEGKEIVIAKRESRDESLWRRLSSKVVYFLIRCISDKDMPIGGFDFCLLGNKARTSLVNCWQPSTFLQIRILSLGFSRKWIGYHREARKGGISRWSFSKKMTYMIDGVLGHSYIPIRIMSLVGVIFSSVSFLLGFFFLIFYIMNGTEVRGLTPIMLLILFLGGLQMLMIGIIGEYLWRCLAQTRNNPPYIIDETLG